MRAVAVESARIVRNGALEHDRMIALFDAGGAFVNGKRTPAIHGLEMTFDPALRTLTFARRGDQQCRTLHLDRERSRIDDWLAEYFGLPVVVKENIAGGWPDDLESPGPTLISTATLREVASWYPGLTVADARARFRTNLEIDGVEPFWEDRLFGPAGVTVGFRIGEVTFNGVNPCQRCAVPPRDPQTGQNYPQFGPTFIARRRATFPPWAESSRFNHFYRLAINTIVRSEEVGRFVRTGDKMSIL